MLPSSSRFVAPLYSEIQYFHKDVPGCNIIYSSGQKQDSTFLLLLYIQKVRPCRATDIRTNLHFRGLHDLELRDAIGASCVLCQEILVESFNLLDVILDA